MGREMAMVETRLRCDDDEPSARPPPIWGEPSRLDHGLLPTRLLSERRLAWPRFAVSEDDSDGGGIMDEAV
jgi:hypothetical protein